MLMKTIGANKIVFVVGCLVRLALAAREWKMKSICGPRQWTKVNYRSDSPYNAVEKDI